MSFRGFGIIIWNNQAYIPSTVECYSGIVIQVEPVYVTGLDAKQITSAAQKVLSSLDEQVRIPDPTPNEWKNRKDPILMATKAKSWKVLARYGHSYGIGWLEQGIRLTFSRLDKKGRWEVDSEKTRIYPLTTPLDEIVKVVLEDFRRKQKDEPAA
jgi:hypothetical protein